MKIINKLIQGTAALSLLSTLALGSIGHAAAAASTGQITAAYKVQDLTSGAAFANPATAASCDTLQYRLRLWNPGAGNVNNVMVELSLPTGSSTSNTSTAFMTADNSDPVSTSVQATVNFSSAQSESYVNGSAQLLDSNTNVVKTLPDSIMQYQGGANIGGLNASQLEYVQFQAKVNCPTPPAPVYSCDLLSLTTESDKTVKLTAFNTTAKNGATFANATIDWGDKTAPLTTSSVVGQTHKFSAYGTYTIAATANFTVNGATKSVTSVSCQKQVTFTENKPPVVVPPTTPVTPPATPPAAPTALVNTGAGNVAGLFAAVTIAGAVAYRWVTSRRLSRQ